MGDHAVTGTAQPAARDLSRLPRLLLLGKGPRLWRDALRRRILACADILVALLVCGALGMFSGAGTGAWALLATPLWLVLAKLFGLYDRDHRTLRHLTIDEAPALAGWTLAACVATVGLLHVAPIDAPHLHVVLALWPAAAVAAFTLRSLGRLLWRHVAPAERAVIVGDGPVALAARRKLELFPDIHVELVGERALSSAGAGAGDWPAGVSRVIVASAAIDEAELAELVRHCRERQIKLSLVPPARGMFGTAVQLSHVADLPVVEYNTWDVSRSTLVLKRAVDLLVAGPLLVLALPLLAAVAVAVRLESPGKALFVQRRAGLRGKPFRILKFRTMAPDPAVPPGRKLADDPRVTRLGRILRRTSLDELPQLVNVVRGDMSLVGPRPEQVEIVDRYGPEERIRLEVKPGLTGPMQVYGRGDLSAEERLAVERDYVETLSLGRDLRILALTLAAVAGGRGAY